MFGEAGVRGVITGRGAFEPTSDDVEPDASPEALFDGDPAAPQHARDPGRHAARTRRRRVDHLHLGLDRHAEGRRGDASLGRRLRRRRGAALPAGGAARARRPRAGRPLGGLRRVLRGDVARVAARRLPRARTPRASCAAAWTSARGWSRHGDHRRLDRADARRAVAGRGDRERAAADLRRRGRARPSSPRASSRPNARCGTPTARPRPPSSPAPRSSTARGRCASACRSTAGRSPWSTPRARPVADGEVGRAHHRRRRPRPLPRPREGRREVLADADARLGARLPLGRPRACSIARGCSSRGVPTTR